MGRAMSDQTKDLRARVAARDPAAIDQSISVIASILKQRGYREVEIQELLSELYLILKLPPSTHHGYQGRGSLVGYALGVLENLKRKERDQQRRLKVASELGTTTMSLLEPASPLPDPAAVALGEALDPGKIPAWEDLVAEAARRAPEQEGRILRLHYIERKTYDEIGRILNMPAGTLRVMAQRAREKYLEPLLDERLLGGARGTLTRIQAIRQSNPALAALAHTVALVPKESQDLWERWLKGESPRDIAWAQYREERHIRQELFRCLVRLVARPELTDQERQLLQQQGETLVSQT